jgi:hypothetical protein
MDETGYITMTRRQSNSKWNVGIAAYRAPKYSDCKNPLVNFWPRFFGIKTASSSLVIFQRDKLSTRSIIHICLCKWSRFEGKKPREVEPGCFVLARKFPGSPGTCNQKVTGLHGLQMSWTPTLFSGSGPVGLPSVPWTKKKQLTAHNFSSDAEVIAAVETCIDG